MDPFEIVMLVLCIVVVAYHVWRDKTPRGPRKELTGRSWVLDRLSLLVMAIAVIVMLPLIAAFGWGLWEAGQTESCTPRPFDQELWLASDPFSGEAKLVRWSMHEDAATHVRPGMTAGEVKAILGEPTVEEQGYMEENEARFEYYMSAPGNGVFGRPQVRVSVWFENGAVKRCTTDRPSS